MKIKLNRGKKIKALSSIIMLHIPHPFTEQWDQVVKSDIKCNHQCQHDQRATEHEEMYPKQTAVL